jgi:DnaK suppressor protein
MTKKQAVKTKKPKTKPNTKTKAKAKKAKEPIKETKKVTAKTTTKTTAKKTAKKTAGKSIKMNPREKKLHDIKKNLLSQKKILLLGALEALNELPGQTMFPDLGDQATAEIDRNFMLRLKGRERKLIKKIDEALERLSQGIFGICDKCGLEIDIRRLEARPVTTMCIECKTLQEEEEKLREK